ncbi:MAG: hypothetical protein WB973_08860 [Thermoanaerobaculia bacterium]
MKKVVYVLSVLILLSTGCKNKPPESTETDATKPTTPDSVATDSVRTDRGSTTVKAKVDFVGLVCHIWDKREAGVERAIVLRTPTSGPLHHKMTIGLPPESKADVVKLKLPIDPVGKCPDGSTCSVLMDGVAFQFVDADGKPLGAAFVPNQNFKDFVTHLSAVPHAANPFEKKENLIDAVFDTVPQKNDPVVAGWFALAGGNGDASKFFCKGKFEGDSEEHDFVDHATVTFTIPKGGRLQAFLGGDTQWRDIAIPASDFDITVDNDAATHLFASHFGEYARLHKKKDSAEPELHLPTVVIANTQICTDTTTTIGVDAVPGCSNSSWP